MWPGPTLVKPGHCLFRPAQPPSASENKTAENSSNPLSEANTIARLTEKGPTMPHMMTAESEAYLIPILRQVSPGGLTRYSDNGRTFYRPVIILSDGEAYDFTVGRDGKGVTSGYFRPRVGSVPTGTPPPEPVVTPRKGTPVPYRTGIFPALQVAAMLADAAIADFSQSYKAQNLKREEQDCSIAAQVLAAAQWAGGRVGTKVSTKTMRGAAESRIMIHGYSRKD